MDSKEKNRILLSITRKGKISSDLMDIVEGDLDAGLGLEDIEEYIRRPSYSVEQKRIYSGMLRRSATDEEKNLICESGLDTEQMQVIYEYYCKDVPLDTIREALETDRKPHHMKEIFERFLSKVEQVKGQKQTEEEKSSGELIRETGSESSGNAKAELLDDNAVAEETMDIQTSDDKKEISEEKDTGMKQVQASSTISPEVLELLEKMNHRLENQDKFYEQMSGTLDKLGKQKEDDDVTKSLLERYNSQEALISSQQDQLNEANRALARLRAEKESAERELQKLKEKQTADEKAASKETVKEEHSSETKESAIKQSQKEGGQSDMGVAQSALVSQPIPPTPKGTIPVYYQVPMTQNGRVIQQVEVERSTRKAVGGVGIFSKLFLKKKSRIDLVSRLAAGDMLPEQLAQIRVAIEKGLYEEQLVELINHNVPVAKMKEIIEIAVLENNMA